MPFLMLAWGFIQKGFSAALTFCSRPPGSWIAAALAACLGLWWFGQHEFNAGAAKCEREHAEAAAQEAIRQIGVITVINNKSDARTAKSNTIKQSNEKVIVHVKDQAQVMPGATDECIPADIADGLRSLR